jgi:tetratricopeptide (TPR) repeat protein
MDAQAGRRATWISGPPGAGKTSLAAGYREYKQGGAFWYRCDPSDCDPANLFHFLAISSLGGGAVLASEHQVDVLGFARHVFRSIGGSGTSPSLWIIDDCHEVEDGALFFNVMDVAMNELPGSCHFIFLGRRPPPAAWSRRIINGELGLVGPADLMFTLPEARQLAESHDSRQDAEYLLSVSGGWAAGLALLLSSHQVVDAAKGRIPDHQQVFDYFATEVFTAASHEARELLVDISIFPTVTIEMAQVASGYSQAGALLERLTRERMFVDLLPGQPPSYRLHDLFRSFLLRWRERSRPVEVRRSEAARAAALLVAAGRHDDALPLLLAHQDWAAAAALLCSRAQNLIAEGRHQTLAGWIEAIPEPERRDNGWLHYWLGLAIGNHDPAMSRIHLGRAATCFRAGGDAGGLALAWCGRVDSYINEWNEVGPLRGLAEELDALLRTQAHALPPAISARVAVAMFAALMYGRPDHPHLDTWVERVGSIIKATDDDRIRLEVGSHLLIYLTWWRGDLPAAGHLVDVLVPLGERTDLPPLSRILWCAMHSGYQWMVAECDAAIETIERGLALAREHSLPWLDFLLCAQGVFAALSIGKRDEARGYLRYMAGTLGSRRRLDAMLYHYLGTWEALDRGDIEKAVGHAEAARVDVEASGSPFHTANALVCLGLLTAQHGDMPAAEQAMGQALQLARQAGNRAVEYQALLHLADFTSVRSDRETTVEYLRDALSLARCQGFRNHAFWSDEQMSRLYALALECSIEEDYVRDTIRLRRLLPPTRGANDAWPVRYRLMTLGGFALYRDGDRVDFAGTLGGKLAELLKALVAHGAVEVPTARLIDVIWPDAEGDQGRRSFDTTLHRLRRMFEGENVLPLRNGLLTLDARYCRCDVLLLEPMLDRLLGRNLDAVEAYKLAIRSLDYWRGDFLAGEDFPWAIARRERIRSLIGRGLQNAVALLDAAGRAEMASDLRRRLQ